MRLSKALAQTGLYVILAAAVPGTLAAQAAAPKAQKGGPVVTGMSSTSSSHGASLTFFLSDGAKRVIALRGGEVLVDGKQVASYDPGGDVERNWRGLVAWAGNLSPDEAVAAGQHWAVEGSFGGEDQKALEAITNTFGTLTPAEKVEAPAPPADLAETVVASTDAAAAARDAAESARVIARGISRDLGDQIRDQIRNSVRVSVPSKRFDPQDYVQSRRSAFVSPIEPLMAGVLGLGGAFLALCAMGFGASFFAGRQIDVMADTIATSFGRSFFVGLFAQPLLLPVFIAMIVGLALTVVGVLLIPVAIIGFIVTLVAAVIGGYLAVARVAGSGWMHRVRGDHGTDAMGILRSIAWGLAILLAIWLPAVLLSWVPALGGPLMVLAIAVTWALATTGLGAAVLTRGGVRTTFGRRFRPLPLPTGSLYEQPGPEISTAEWMASGREP